MCLIEFLANLVLLLIAVSAGTAIMSHLILFYETENQPPARRNTSFGRELWPSLRQTVEEGWWLSVFHLLLPAGLFDGDREFNRRRPRERRPVLLVHGYLQNRSNFHFLRRRLGRDYPAGIYTVNLPLTGSIEGLALGLKRRVDEVLRETGAASLDIVAHSQGGLVSRFYILNLDGARAVSRCICIATPLRGSRLAVFGPGENARQMRPGSALLESLATGTPGDPVVWHALWSASDNLVIPPESACGEVSFRSASFDMIGHMSLLYAPEVYARLLQILSDGPASPAA